MVDQQLARLAALGDAPAEQHLAHGGGVGQAKQHDIGLGAQLGGGRHGPGAQIDQWLALSDERFHTTRRYPAASRASTHRQAHQADPGEGNGWQIGHETAPW